MKHGGISGGDRHWLLDRFKTFGFDRKRIFSDRNRAKEEFTRGRALHLLREIGRLRAQSEVCSRNGLVLRIEYNPAHIAEDRGVRMAGAEKNKHRAYRRA